MRKEFKSNKNVTIQNTFINFDTAELLSPVITPNFQIIQIADSYYASNFAIGKHNQLCDLELTFVLYGTVTVNVNGKISVLKKGDVQISFKNEPHEVSIHNVCRFQTVAFNFLNNEKVLKIFEKVKQNYSFKRIINALELDVIFSDILTEFPIKANGESEIILDSLITQLLIKLIRINDLKNENKLKIDIVKLPSLLTEYIDANFKKINSLIELSNHFGYSHNYLCKIFKQEYDTTMNAYLLSKKMEYAKEKLKKGVEVTKIAETLSYSNPYNFSRAYKNYFGYSPTKQI